VQVNFQRNDEIILARFVSLAHLFILSQVYCQKYGELVRMHQIRREMEMLMWLIGEIWHLLQSFTQNNFELKAKPFRLC
jgi:hypothetical protein